MKTSKLTRKNTKSCCSNRQRRRRNSRGLSRWVLKSMRWFKRRSGIGRSRKETLRLTESKSLKKSKRSWTRCGRRSLTRQPTANQLKNRVSLPKVFKRVKVNPLWSHKNRLNRNSFQWKICTPANRMSQDRALLNHRRNPVNQGSSCSLQWRRNQRKMTQTHGVNSTLSLLLRCRRTHSTEPSTRMISLALLTETRRAIWSSSRMRKATTTRTTTWPTRRDICWIMSLLTWLRTRKAASCSRVTSWQRVVNCRHLSSSNDSISTRTRSLVTSTWSTESTRFLKKVRVF